MRGTDVSEYPQPPYPPQGQPAQGYPAQGYPAQPYPGARTNTMAILSLVFAFIFCPLGIVFGHIAKGQIRRTGEAGGGLATAGLILGYVFTALAVVYVIVVVVIVGAAAQQGSF